MAGTPFSLFCSTVPHRICVLCAFLCVLCVSALNSIYKARKHPMNGLLTDLYELTMAAGYFECGKANEKATFEFTIRRLPAHRNYVVVAGIPQVVDYLLNLRRR